MEGGLIFFTAQWFTPARPLRAHRRRSRRTRREREGVRQNLHEAHGGKFVRVRGNRKVFLHLMFGLIVVTAEQIFSTAILT